MSEQPLSQLAASLMEGDVTPSPSPRMEMKHDHHHQGYGWWAFIFYFLVFALILYFVFFALRPSFVLDGNHSGSFSSDDNDDREINNGKLNFNAHSGELGGDPIFGQVKTFYIKYRYRGQLKEKSFREGDNVSLP